MSGSLDIHLLHEKQKVKERIKEIEFVKLLKTFLQTRDRVYVKVSFQINSVTFISAMRVLGVVSFPVFCF
jgi:hypothetical protein